MIGKCLAGVSQHQNTTEVIKESRYLTLCGILLQLFDNPILVLTQQTKHSTMLKLLHIRVCLTEFAMYRWNSWQIFAFFMRWASSFLNYYIIIKLLKVSFEIWKFVMEIKIWCVCMCEFVLLFLLFNEADCFVENSTYRHGETFKIDCRMQCICEVSLHIFTQTFFISNNSIMKLKCLHFDIIKFILFEKKII